jgi:hypothetical protein
VQYVTCASQSYRIASRCPPRPLLPTSVAGGTTWFAGLCNKLLNLKVCSVPRSLECTTANRVASTTTTQARANSTAVVLP